MQTAIAAYRQHVAKGTVQDVAKRGVTDGLPTYGKLMVLQKPVSGNLLHGRINTQD
jgi:hypothetical protein